MISKSYLSLFYARKDIFIPYNDRGMIPLGFALELPSNWEGKLAPRSSTFKTWGLIQTNSVGIVDDSYIGDNDEWHMPVFCLQPKDTVEVDVLGTKVNIQGTIVKKGDKVGQLRIQESMPELELEEVDIFGNDDRGGFGTTGTN